ncbi:hypothetical protein [Paenibacillus graminis]|uniref:hypothetical protein n=1 Tax=Paenibacillus graminis TaxID=189425 RepID=UPI002DBB5DC2|nr:hypothetical protein [Paenibacillus graminis]MEC0167919.1 hypothetical protein [Paenibacillus graminis]
MTRKLGADYEQLVAEARQNPEVAAWLDAEECARCGFNPIVPGYEWCAECRPELAESKS